VRRIALILAALVAAALLVAGCGGSSGGGSGDEPASLAPSEAPVYLEVELGAEGKQSEEFNELTQIVLGIDNVGEFIAEQLEQQALGSKEKFDFEEEVEPWLGDKAGMYLAHYDGDDFDGYGVIFGTTDVGEAEEFIEKRVAAGSEEAAEEGEFEGDKYYVEADGETTLGVVGDYVVFGETKADFEAMVETEEAGEGLADSERFQQATESSADEGLGSVYVDIGGLIEEAKGTIDAETEAGLALLGIEPREATAVATLVPHSEQVELDLSTNITRAAESGGDASAQLEALPATAVLAFAEPEFGKAFGEGLHEFSEQGVPGQFEPGELEGVFEQLGINFKSLGTSLGAISGFVEGSTRRSLGGAVMVEMSDAAEAKDLVAKIGLVLRASGDAGVTAISGELSGFSVRTPTLEQPVLVGAAGEKIVIAYGAKALAQALRKQAKPLGKTPDFEAAKAALGSSPINVFLDGGPALKLVDTMIPIDKREAFDGAKPYLRKIAYAALGSEAKEGVTSAKLIIGVQK
jgi:uncharacterized protein DUF3352